MNPEWSYWGVELSRQFVENVGGKVPLSECESGGPNQKGLLYFYFISPMQFYDVIILT